MAVNSSDPDIAAAVKSVANKMGINHADALKLLVAKGAEAVAAQTGANAFTTGSTLFFEGDKTGKALLGHELTHTIQQSTKKISSGSSTK